MDVEVLRGRKEGGSLSSRDRDREQDTFYPLRFVAEETSEPVSAGVDVSFFVAIPDK